MSRVSARSRWLALATFMGCWLLCLTRCPAAPTKPVKNVIVLIADGCGAEHYTLARWYRGYPLALDGILVGAVQTYIADSVVADSAPAASAFATGTRTSDKVISVGPGPVTLPCVPEPAPGMRYRPRATVLEGARLLGKSTGVIATARVSHATPAAYMAHVPSRKQEDDIMEQAVYQRVDVVLGGGADELIPKSAEGKRADGEDLRKILEELGYQQPATRQELQQIESGKVFGMFSAGPMSPEIDRPALRPEEPTLAEMTAKALQLLSKNPHGFLLMVEGSQVDWADHANDPAHLLSDLLAFDDAVKAALDFAKRDGQTLLLAMSDHNTGGLTIGNQRTNYNYSQMSVNELLGPFKRMRLSAAGIWDKLCGDRGRDAVKPKQMDPQAVQRAVQEYWSITIDLSAAQEILDIAARQRPAYAHWAIGEVVCREATCLGWTTHGHTGGDVPLFAYGPKRPRGLIAAPDIARITARALGLHLLALNQRLFVDARQALPEAQIDVEEASPENRVVKIVAGERKAELPVNKSLLVLDGQPVELEGVVVCAPPLAPQAPCRVFLPQQALQKILGRSEPLPVVHRR